jgi:hypothetical protein
MIMVRRVDDFARRKIKERRRAFRRNWALVAAIMLPLCLIAALALRLLFGTREVPIWSLGPIMIVTALWAMRSQLEGTYHLETGLEAEGWTSKDLRKGLGRGWYVVDGISFGERGDVDHVVIGPAGVFVIETKYTDSPLASRSGRETVLGWIEQSRDNANRIRRLLKHNYGHDVDALPLVVTSGTELLTLPAEVEDTYVVRRRNLQKVTGAWRTMPQILSSERIESIRAALLDFRGIRDDFERNRAS